MSENVRLPGGGWINPKRGKKALADAQDAHNESIGVFLQSRMQDGYRLTTIGEVWDGKKNHTEEGIEVSIAIPASIANMPMNLVRAALTCRAGDKITVWVNSGSREFDPDYPCMVLIKARQ